MGERPEKGGGEAGEGWGRGQRRVGERPEKGGGEAGEGWGRGQRRVGERPEKGGGEAGEGWGRGQRRVVERPEVIVGERKDFHRQCIIVSILIPFQTAASWFLLSSNLWWSPTHRAVQRARPVLAWSSLCLAPSPVSQI